MTEDEINAEIALVTQNISDILQAGSEYETESSGSRRKTKWTELDKLRNHRSYLQQELAAITGTNTVMIQF